MLFVATAQDGTSILLVDLPEPAPAQPAVRRANYHLFNATISSLPEISTVVTSGPPTRPENKPGYFDCVACVSKAKGDTLMGDNKYVCNLAVPPSGKRSREGSSSDATSPDLSFCLVMDYLRKKAASIRPRLHITRKLKAVVLKDQSTLPHEHKGENSNPQPVAEYQHVVQDSTPQLLRRH